MDSPTSRRNCLDCCNLATPTSWDPAGYHGRQFKHFQQIERLRMTSGPFAAIRAYGFALLSDWSVGHRPRSFRNKAHQARSICSDLSWAPHYHRRSRPPRRAWSEISVRDQQPMDHRWLAAMERGALHQSFLRAKCKAGGTQRRDRDRGIAPDRARGRNHLRLWTRLSKVFFGEWGLPLRSLP